LLTADSPIACATVQGGPVINQAGVVEAVPVQAMPPLDTNVFLSFPDFSSTTGFKFYASATNLTTADGPVVRLVPALVGQVGSIFSTNRVNAAAFSAFFTFRITAPGGLGGGADGIVFVIKGTSLRFGGDGGGLGYLGMTNSAGVEFDIYNNSTLRNDPNANHVGIDVGGAFDSAPGETNTAPVSPSMKDGNRWFAWIDYDGSVLEARVNETGIRPSLPNVSRTVNITNEIISPVGKVGFTAATGGGYANHDILSWQFNSGFSPIHAVSPGVAIQLFEAELQIYPVLSITGSVGSTYQVQYVNRLATTDSWLPLANLVLTNNPSLWWDTTGFTTPTRFYRVVPY
jgi:hypothetical protein